MGMPVDQDGLIIPGAFGQKSANAYKNIDFNYLSTILNIVPQMGGCVFRCAAKKKPSFISKFIMV